MIWIYLFGMLSSWLGFYLYCKVIGSFTHGQLIIVAIVSLVPVANLLGIAFVLGLISLILSESKFMKQKYSVKRFNIGD